MSKEQYIEQLMNSIAQLRKLLENQTQESHEERTATIMQYSVLMFLKENENSTVGNIGTHFRLSKSSATQFIDRLVKAKLVKRLNDPKDRRIVRLVATAEGERKIVDLKKRFRDKISKVLLKIPEVDLKELNRIHNNLIETLKKAQNN